MPWIASTEPEQFRKIPGWTTTNLPEKYGVDYLWRAAGGYCGVQRKELSDLLASVSDGRLAKEVQQMKPLVYRWLVVEGEPKWTTEGVMMKVYGKPWTKKQYENQLRTVAASAVIVEQTRDLADTWELMGELIAWSKRPHMSLHKRPGPTSIWGTCDDRDYQLHFLQGLPGVGAELADRILNHLGMPIGWRVTKKELLEIPGLGKKKVEAIWAALSPLSP